MSRIKTFLESWPMLKWDRYIRFLDGTIVLYGWMNHAKKQHYKDFVCVVLRPEGRAFLVATSSPTFHEEWAKRYDRKMIACERVEHLPDPPRNCVRLP